MLKKTQVKELVKAIGDSIQNTLYSTVKKNCPGCGQINRQGKKLLMHSDASYSRKCFNCNMVWTTPD